MTVPTKRMNMSGTDTRQVRLRWTGTGMSFEGGPDGGPQMVVDSAVKDGLSPMQLLLTAVAGCMAIDVLMIAEKSRVPIDSLEVEAVGVRADEAPKRFVSMTLVYRVTGPSEEDRPKVDRAIELSRDKYCSVLHTLDPDLDFDLRLELG